MATEECNDEGAYPTESIQFSVYILCGNSGSFSIGFLYTHRPHPATP
jgi:hypothetical protein